MPPEIQGPARPIAEGGFDYGLAVNQVVAVGFVLEHMDAAADLGQNHGADKFIFNPNGFPFTVDRFFGDPIGKRQGINFATTSLVNSFFQEHGIFVGRQRQVCGDVHHFHGHLDGVGPGSVGAARDGFLQFNNVRSIHTPSSARQFSPFDSFQAFLPLFRQFEDDEQEPGETNPGVEPEGAGGAELRIQQRKRIG